MDLFTGLTKTDYQDILRAVGYYADSRGLRNVRILETEDGLVVQGVIKKAGTSSQLETYLMTSEDLKAMLHEAYQRRNRPPSPRDTASSS